MARPLRIPYLSAWHHVMNCGGGYRVIAHGDEDEIGPGLPVEKSAY
jgi:hypothetical protein